MANGSALREGATTVTQLTAECGRKGERRRSGPTPVFPLEVGGVRIEADRRHGERRQQSSLGDLLLFRDIHDERLV